MFLQNVFLQLQLQNFDLLCGVSNTVFSVGNFLVHHILVHHILVHNTLVYQILVHHILD
jgi:hypothetical protein